MKTDVAVMLFKTRADFRGWLNENAETADGIWLALGKTKAAATLSANDALEEALCYGWIDGQMQSVDADVYHKYFARRRPKSRWSDKNKKTVESLRKKGLMTALGEQAVDTAKNNGSWDEQEPNPITPEQIDAFTEKLAGLPPAREHPAYVNFLKMPPSVRRSYTGRYHSFKTEEARMRDFERIVDRLNKNLKPM